MYTFYRFFQKALLNQLAPSTTKEKSRKSSVPAIKQVEASNSKTVQENKEKAENEKKRKEQIEKEMKEAEERELERLLDRQAENMSVDVIDLTL